jgi:branched-chain amino acid transport system permease protein
MVYGIVQLINFAHGEIYMIGAFTALIVISVLTMMGWNQIAILLIAAAGCHCLFVGLRLHHGKNRLQTPAQGPPAVGPDQCHRHVPVPAKLCSPGPDLGFLPFPGLIPDFEFMDPIAHIIGSPEW